jgi:hypothetical protein
MGGDDSYRVGYCDKDVSNQFYEHGLESVIFGNFKSMTLCFMRDNTLNYHALA